MQISAVNNCQNYNNTVCFQRANYKQALRPSSNAQYSIQNKPKHFLLTMLTALSLITGAYSCTKEPIPENTDPIEEYIVHSNNSNYPDARPEVMKEFIIWYQDNCPYWNWPDYEGSYPADWEEQRVQFQLDIENWWHEHGYPDWHTGG